MQYKCFCMSTVNSNLFTCIFFLDPKRCYIPKGMHFNLSFIWDMFCNVQSDTCRPKRSPNIKSFFAPREQSRWDSQRDSPQSYSVWLHWTAVFVAQSTVQWRNRRKEKCFKYGWLSNLKMVNNEYSFKFKSYTTNRLATFKWERIMNWNPKRSTGEYPGRCGCNRSGSPLPHRVCPTVRISLLLCAPQYHIIQTATNKCRCYTSAMICHHAPYENIKCQTMPCPTKQAIDGMRPH